LFEKLNKNPLNLYLLLSFTISWSTWFIASILTGNKGPLLGAADLAGAFAPSISAILVSFYCHS
jgi:hypothetical protein